ncbi:MAG: thiolase domain-containing protein [Theionarchaea archaeon]|nr:thiolase domain-containing protein [Theionarchaea archaeon]
MREVGILGIGQVQVAERWETSLRELAYYSIKEALADAQVPGVDALYVGNMLAGELSGQEHLGALISDYAGFNGIEAVRVEAAAASGGAALRQGFLSVASGMHDVVVVTGVEQMTDVLPEKVEFGLSLALDSEFELASGISPTALFALLTRRYMHDYAYSPEDLAAFPVNAHRNSVGNEYAMYQGEIRIESVVQSPMVADPIHALECPPVCDGSASVILGCLEEGDDRCVKISGSAMATDTIGLDNREDPLELMAVKKSTDKAYEMASKASEDIDFFEVHDLFPIVAALSLEAAGFAPKGEGALLARNDEIRLEGTIPITTMGGCKARGNPVGACGVYQAVEAVRQLRGEAGKNQLDATVGMIQCIGGTAATAVTHILEV